MAGESFTQDLRRNSVTWKFIDIEGIANPAAPTLAELNSSDSSSTPRAPSMRRTRR